MTPAFNYRYHRARYNPEKVKILPAEGIWVPVATAANVLNVSKQTIRIWYLKGQMKSVLFKKKIWVNISAGQD